MLKELHIKNYALIQKIDLDFEAGLTIITGETGAGKSILLGGLELVRGKRAQQGLLKNPDEKSVVEAMFDVEKYHLKKFFQTEDLDYESQTIIRRELLPGGKSRAFVNDTPVRLDSLVNLTEKLIDIHSQHQTLELNQKEYQFALLDAVSKNEKLLNSYKAEYQQYKSLNANLSELKSKLDSAEKELEYKNFQLKELQELNLDELQPETMEQQLQMMEHTEEIKTVLAEAFHLLDDESIGVQSQVLQIKTAFARIARLSDKYRQIENRFESIQIELQDLAMEIENLSEDTDFNPAEKEHLQALNDRYNMLLIKHKAIDINALIDLRNQLANEVNDLSSLQEQIADLQSKIVQKESLLNDLSSKIHQNRVEATPKLISQIEKILQRLSMHNTRLKIDLLPQNYFLYNGKDDLQFQISSDAGKSFGDLKRIASGGELSRLMLAVKTVLSKYKKLPTIIFDEIDSGVSGEVAQNMSEVLKELSRNMQVIVITHLPQIAVAGAQHFKVFKTSKGDINTQVKQLNKEERIYEIAEMIEGKSPSDSALQHAKHLLGY
jgi:DNA repair protein RecN (Recombination protein N)